MKDKPHSRGKQILRELYENGPLNATGIRCLLDPPISKSGVKQALRLLKKRKLILPDETSYQVSRTYSYQISLTGNTRPIIAKLLDLPEAALRKPHIRAPDMFHSQECAIWCKWFRWMFPDAIVARDLHYKTDPRFKLPFTIAEKNWPLRPDILMLMPKEDSKRSITVALDIERSHFYPERWADKVRKVFKSGEIDGMICFGSEDMISETAEILFERRRHAKMTSQKCSFAQRTLFSTRGWSVSENAPDMLDWRLQPASLYEWIHFLQTTDHEKPHNSKSETVVRRV